MATRAAHIKKIAKLMADLDFCMMTTRDGKQFRSRPMSNNGEVEFDGDVWFFSSTDSRKVAEIETHPVVHLGYTDMERWLFISMTGKASIVTDVDKKKELWMKELEQWFEDGPESEDVVLIKVTPTNVAWWGEKDQDEVELV